MVKSALISSESYAPVSFSTDFKRRSAQERILEMQLHRKPVRVVGRVHAAVDLRENRSLFKVNVRGKSVPPACTPEAIRPAVTLFLTCRVIAWRGSGHAGDVPRKPDLALLQDLPGFFWLVELCVDHGEIKK